MFADVGTKTAGYYDVSISVQMLEQRQLGTQRLKPHQWMNVAPGQEWSRQGQGPTVQWEGNVYKPQPLQWSDAACNAHAHDNGIQEAVADTTTCNMHATMTTGL